MCLQPEIEIRMKKGKEEIRINIAKKTLFLFFVHNSKTVLC